MSYPPYNQQGGFVSQFSTFPASGNSPSFSSQSLHGQGSLPAQPPVQPTSHMYRYGTGQDSPISSFSSVNPSSVASEELSHVSQQGSQYNPNPPYAAGAVQSHLQTTPTTQNGGSIINTNYAGSSVINQAQTASIHSNQYPRNKSPKQMGLPSTSNPGPSGPPSPSKPEDVLKVINSLGSSESPEIAQSLRSIAHDSHYRIVENDHYKQIEHLIQKKQIELAYYNQVRAIRQAQPNAVFRDGYSGYGNGWTGNASKIIYPRDRKRSRRISREVLLTKEMNETIATAQEQLVPIRLDFDVDRFRLRDTFTWNLNEKHISINQFADHLVEDFSFPQGLAPSISSSIQEQINDFHPHAFPSNTSTYQPFSAYHNEDMRIPVKLDITVGHHNLVDQFEWDINCKENSPEDFAEKMCSELNLSGEFVTAIAHAIREQTQLYTKSLFLVGHTFDGRQVEDDDIRRELCPTVFDYLRPKTLIKDFSPVLFEIPEAELDRQDKDRDRDSRRKRRQGRAGRRGGPVLPDLRETIRTFRTPVYSSVLPGGVDRNMELLRKLQKSDESDNEDERPGHNRRGRNAAHVAQAAISGLTYTKHASPGRPPLHRNLNSVTTPGVDIPPQNRVQPSPLSYGHTERFIVKLKVPNLRNILR